MTQTERTTPEELPKLKPKEQIFLNEYITNGFNASKAAIAAGYPIKSAPDFGHRLSKNVNINIHIDAHIQHIRESCKRKHELRTQELEEILSLDFNDIVKIAEDGRSFELIPTALQKPGIGKHIQEITITPNGNIRVKFESKEAAREMLNKHYGFYEKDNSQRLPDAAVVYVPDNGRGPKP